MKPAKATHPLALPTRAPPCFDSQAMWNQYRRDANSSAGDGFTYCTDCLPAHKRAMQAQGRCRFPGTVFVMVSTVTVTVGRRRRVVQ